MIHAAACIAANELSIHTDTFQYSSGFWKLPGGFLMTITKNLNNTLQELKKISHLLPLTGQLLPQWLDQQVQTSNHYYCIVYMYVHK